MERRADCHPDLRHHARGLCFTCYKRQQQRRWRATPSGSSREQANRRRANAKDRASGRAKVRDAVKYALMTGRLTRGPCEVCGAERVHAHHPDYAKPLEVVWVCPKHHAAFHQ